MTRDCHHPRENDTGSRQHGATLCPAQGSRSAVLPRPRGILLDWDPPIPTLPRQSRGPGWTRWGTQLVCPAGLGLASQSTTVDDLFPIPWHPKTPQERPITGSRGGGEHGLGSTLSDGQVRGKGSS